MSNGHPDLMKHLMALGVTVVISSVFAVLIFINPGTTDAADAFFQRARDQVEQRGTDDVSDKIYTAYVVSHLVEDIRELRRLGTSLRFAMVAIFAALLHHLIISRFFPHEP